MTLGLVLTAVLLGVRHGFDWDHIAAISDLTTSTTDRRRGFALSFIYSLGHAAVVFALGAAVIVFGSSIPDGLDEWAGRFAGVTLVGLGCWVVVGLCRRGRDFRLRSRWVLIISGTFAGLRHVSGGRFDRVIRIQHDHPHEHEHEHDLPAAPGGGGEAASHQDAHLHDHSHMEVEAPRVAALPVRAGGPSLPAPHWHTHSHPHGHHLHLPSSATARYGNGTAAGVGMLHGVGIESPSQIAVFVASTTVGGATAGVLLLIAWVGGLILANSMLAIAAGLGFLHAEKNFAFRAALSALVAVGSILVGVALLAGVDNLSDLVT